MAKQSQSDQHGCHGALLQFDKLSPATFPDMRTILLLRINLASLFLPFQMSGCTGGSFWTLLPRYLEHLYVPVVHVGVPSSGLPPEHLDQHLPAT